MIISVADDIVMVGACYEYIVVCLEAIWLRDFRTLTVLGQNNVLKDVC